MSRLRELAARRPFAAALLVALVLLLVPYRTLLGPGVPSGRDLLPYFYPLKTHLVEALRAGEMPWVDRFRQGGLPLLAWPGVAAFDPGNLLFLLLPTAAAAKAWMLLRVLTGAAGFAVFLRVSGLPPYSSALGALAWGASGITASSASFLSTSSALAALPWVAAALLRARSRRDGRSLALLAVATALLVLAALPEPLLVAALLALVLLSGRGPAPGLRERAGALVLWAAAGTLGALLAAPALAASLVTALEGVRSVPGALLPAFAAQGALPLARLPDLLADGLVADWTRVVRAEGVPSYPYFPSLTPGRLAWTLALLGLVAGRGARLRALALALAGSLLALGPATPLFRLLTETVPFAGTMRYPEKYTLLFGFGVLWLAALGASALERALPPGRGTAAFALLAAVVVLDRSAVTPRLLPMAPAAILEERPAVLASLSSTSPGEPPPRVFVFAAYRVPKGAATDDPGETGAALSRWASPTVASRFGVANVLERDYDVSLPLPQLDRVLLLETAPPGSPVPAALARAAGAVATVEGGRDPDGRAVPVLRPIPDPVPPFRFVARLVRGGNPREAAARFLAAGAPVDVAFVPGTRAVEEAAPGRLLRVSDRPSGLELEVEGLGPGASRLLLSRPLVAARRALLDGRAVAVEEANGGFATVAVPPGRHLLRLRPEGGWLIIAAVLAAVGLAVTVVLLRGRGAGAPT